MQELCLKEFVDILKTHTTLFIIPDKKVQVNLKIMCRKGLSIDKIINNYSQFDDEWIYLQINSRHPYAGIA